MKSLIFVSLISLTIFSSCSKEYNCSCFVSDTSASHVETIKVKSKSDVSSRQKACESEAKSRTTTTESWECSIK